MLVGMDRHPPQDGSSDSTQEPDGAGGGRARVWPRRALLLAMDAAMLWLALWFAYQIGFLVEPDRFSEVYRRQFWAVAPWLVAGRLVLLWILGLYRGFTRYTGLYELTTIGTACLAGTLGLGVLDLVAGRVEGLMRVPRGVVVIDLLLAVYGLGGVRLLRRIVGERLVQLTAGRRRRVLIVGTGDAGESIARSMLRLYRDRYRPVAFIAEDRVDVGRRIHGVPVAGTLDQLSEVCRARAVDSVVIALPRATPALLRSMVNRLTDQRIEFRIMPGLDAVLEGQVEFSQLRRVEIEDLLGRPAIEVADQAATSCLRGRRVLVTGAGGSIGSELCRQALEHRPVSLLLLGRGENSIYEIQQELAGRARELGVPVRALIGDVRDAAFVEGLFAQAPPQVVLHAAAHKHVHFMEAQPAEAIKNNVRGTRLLAEASVRAGVERFILISTDKAVRPAGVMGASKRVAELIVTALNREGGTRFVSVRFGNVLGSRGSVIPLFRRQIAAGGPVTITHPDVSRYFMTIPEAVSLVLQAGTRGDGGEVFLLDMGEPIRIVDLARQLILLSGLEPGRDIAIEFTGLRPGEKISEELLTADEHRQPTDHPKIFRSERAAWDWERLRPLVERLEALAAQPQPDAQAIRALLAELIPDYRPASTTFGA